MARQSAQFKKNQFPDDAVMAAMGSSHRVFINHNRISQATRLADGDEILLGQT
jgi:pSer/pThr/pTyr-binding forkhead associated (FHA) protein